MQDKEKGLTKEDLDQFIKILKDSLNESSLENKNKSFKEKKLEKELKEKSEKRTNVICNINKLLEKARDQEDYKQTINEVLELSIKELGRDHADTAITYSRVSAFFYQKGNLDKAIEFNNKTLEILREFLGDNYLKAINPGKSLKVKGGVLNSIWTHLKTTGVIYSLSGNAYKDKGNLEKAIECNERALNILTKTTHRNEGQFLDVLELHYCLGELYLKKEDYNKAIECFNDLLKNNRKDACHSTAYNGLGIAYEKQGDLEKALYFYKKSLVALFKQKGKDQELKDDYVEESFKLFRASLSLEKTFGHYESIKYCKKALKILSNIN